MLPPTRLLPSLAALLLSASIAAAEEPSTPSVGCDSFAWDVAAELDTLSAPARDVTASAGEPEQPALIEPGHHYRVRLLPQDRTRLAVAPHKPPPEDGAHAGLLGFRVATAGRYRVSVDSHYRIEVIDAGQALAATAFQGRHGCAAIRKIVEFELPAGRDLVLQLANAEQEYASLAITAAPAPAH